MNEYGARIRLVRHWGKNAGAGRRKNTFQGDALETLLASFTSAHQSFHQHVEAISNTEEEIRVRNTREKGKIKGRWQARSERTGIPDLELHLLALHVHDLGAIIDTTDAPTHCHSTTKGQQWVEKRGEFEGRSKTPNRNCACRTRSTRRGAKVQERRTQSW